MFNSHAPHQRYAVYSIPCINTKIKAVFYPNCVYFEFLSQTCLGYTEVSSPYLRQNRC